jgi:DnaJ-class molecular chaperone
MSDYNFVSKLSAYTILSDPEKKRKYDTLGDEDFPDPGRGQQFHGGNFHFNFDDIFSHFEHFNTHQQFHKAGGHHSHHGGFEQHFNFEDFFEEVKTSITFCIQKFISILAAPSPVPRRTL